MVVSVNDTILEIVLERRPERLFEAVRLAVFVCRWVRVNVMSLVGSSVSARVLDGVSGGVIVIVRVRIRESDGDLSSDHDIDCVRNLVTLSLLSVTVSVIELDRRFVGLVNVTDGD